MTSLLYYISGHGFGHAVRSAEILRRLLARRPDLDIHVRTTAPRAVFFGLERASVRLEPVRIDSGVVEKSPLQVDVPATLAELRCLFAQRADILRTESAYVRDHDIRLIVADVPYLAGRVARATDRRCVMIGNFTWDWIYEPYFDAHTDEDLRGFVAEGYAAADLLLRLPFGHPMQNISRIIDVPLVARRSSRLPADIRADVGLAVDPRPVVLVGMRGTLPEETLTRVAEENADLVFLHLQEPGKRQPENLRSVALSETLAYPDVLLVADAVVSKFGYGMVADLIANDKRLLWPKRSEFREDEIFAARASTYLPTLEISRADFAGGRWGDPLRELLSLPPASTRIATDGGDVCASLLLDMLSG